MRCPSRAFAARCRSLLAAAILSGAAGVAGGAVIYVDAGASGANNGSSWANAYTDLQAALAEARNTGSPGDEIWVAAGTYVPGALQTDSFELVSDIGLYGGFVGGPSGETLRSERDWAANATILSGDVLGDDQPDFTNYGENTFHVVRAVDGSTIDGFVVTGGYAHEPGHPLGGGLYVYNVSNVDVVNCEFMRNRDQGGGAACELASAVTFTDCVFTENRTGQFINHGGFYDDSGADLRFEGCSFVDNDDGIYLDGTSNVVIIDCDFQSTGIGIRDSGARGIDISTCTFTTNSAGIYLWPNTLFSISISGCLFDGNDNAGNHGSGIRLVSAQGTVTNCTFQNNGGDGLGMEGVTDLVVSQCDFIGNERGVYTSNSSPTIQNCTFTNNIGDSGCGIRSWQDSPQVTGCTFTGNAANSQGGAVYGEGGNPVITSCTFDGNSADQAGGAVYLLMVDLGVTTLTDCEFTGNSATGDGGAVACEGSSPLLSGCTFRNNTSGSRGGGLGAFSAHPGMGHVGSAPMLNGCAFSANTADDGGAVAHICDAGWNTLPHYRNCVFAANTASGYAGAMYNEYSAPTVTNCTFSDNDATGAGNAVYNTYSNPVFANCVFWDSFVFVRPQIQSVGTGTCTVTYSDVRGGYTGQGNIDELPAFVDRTDPDGLDDTFGTADDGLQLQAGSGCIDSGDDTAVPMDITTDIVGAPRIVGVAVEMGAYEYDPNLQPVADAVATPQSGAAPLDVHFDGTGSSDPDGTVDAYLWEVDGVTIATTAECDYTFPDTRAEPTTYTVTLTVTDNEGGTGSDSVTITVNPPVDTDTDGLPDHWEDLYYNAGDPTKLDSSLPDSNSNSTSDADEDHDGDGLTNLEEYLNDTNPLLVDTDGDLMPDDWEVQYGLDPTTDDAVLDADGDTLGNLLEYQIGTEPDNTDSDGDNLPDEWEYQYYDAGDPTKLDPALADSDTNSTSDAGEDHDGDGLTNFQEYLNDTSPLLVDTDGDLMPDDWEVQYGLDPTTDDAVLDADGDTLGNLLEYQIGTEPDNTDSDGDSLPDGWEYQYYDAGDPTKLDPALADSDSDLTSDADEDDDGDGHTNYEEYLGSSDPGDPNSVPAALTTGGGGRGCAAGANSDFPLAVALAFAVAYLVLRRETRRLLSR